MKPLRECRLYTFIDTAYLHGRDPDAIARDLCDGGSDLIQIRAKGADKNGVQVLADAILPVTRAANVGLVINDHPDIAERAGADLCHLGQKDYFDAGIRSRIPFGLSTHSPGQAERAGEAKPAYIAVGPVYATGTKPGAKPVTLDYVRWAAANLMIPWFAIGGITLQNIDDVLRAGARRICVVSAILNASNVRQTCQAFAERLRCAPT
ncbi:MAG TPA: thiamine phosphate synthase [Candidatus Binatia bacterium]|nr:thiamine phosphate synthase [Candidatus Binatia bacterium]